MNASRAAVALYVALALHALLLLALALRPQAQDGSGSGIGLSLSGTALSDADRALASAVQHEVEARPLLPTGGALPRTTPAQEAARPAREHGGGGRDTYFARLRAHLARHRQPLTQAWIGARALVEIELGADGRIAQLALLEGSGHAGFDAEALDLVRRAAPLPPPPGARAMRLRIPVTLDGRE